jgi:hypothetical protein
MRPESLGLHPAVYFYSATGNYQPTAFLAAIRLVQDFEEKDELNVFTRHREVFEEFLVAHKFVVNQIVRRFGAKDRSLTGVFRLYRHIFDGVVAGNRADEILPRFVEDDYFAFLRPIIDFDKGAKRDFTSERKSALFLRKALEGATRCEICRARLHRGSIQVDHVQDKKRGGKGTDDNAGLVHPYCNSTYKDWLATASAGNASALVK